MWLKVIYLHKDFCETRDLETLIFIFYFFFFYLFIYTVDLHIQSITKELH